MKRRVRTPGSYYRAVVLPSVPGSVLPPTTSAPDDSSPALPAAATAPIPARASPPTAAVPTITSSDRLHSPADDDMSLSDIELPSWVSLSKLIDSRRPRLPPTRREAKGLVEVLVWAPPEVRDSSIVGIAKQWDMRLVWSSVAAERAIKKIERRDPRPPSESAARSRGGRPAHGRVCSAPGAASVPAEIPDTAFSEFAPRSPVAEEARAALASPLAYAPSSSTGRPAPLPSRIPRPKKPRHPAAAIVSAPSHFPGPSAAPPEAEPEASSEGASSSEPDQDHTPPPQPRLTVESLIKPISDMRGMRGYRAGRL